MTSATEQIARIGAKISRLIRDLNASDLENGRLRQEIEELRRKQQDLSDRCRNLEDQVGILKSAAGRLDDPARKDMEKRLSQYIREIDRCIALLGH